MPARPLPDAAAVVTANAMPSMATSHGNMTGYMRRPSAVIVVVVIVTPVFAPDRYMPVRGFARAIVNGIGTHAPLPASIVVALAVPVADSFAIVTDALAIFASVTAVSAIFAVVTAESAILTVEIAPLSIVHVAPDALTVMSP